MAYIEALVQPTPNDPGVTATPIPDLSLGMIKPADGATTETRLIFHKKIVEQRTELINWWLRRMIAVEQPLTEKLTLLWHNHFATSIDKVRYPADMAAQNEKFRSLCLGDFRMLAYAMLTDTALVRWLDGQSNRKGAPNENLAREFLELFALGHGNGYTEKDVREGARALTGWVIEPDGTTALVPRRQDTGSKIVLGASGNLDAESFCDAVLSHPKSARFIAARLWNQLAADSPDPTAGTMTRLLDAYGSARNLRALTQAVFSDPNFSNSSATVIVSPLEWLIGLHRTLRIKIDTEPEAKRTRSALKALGQLPFYPPSVGGWPGAQSWLSAASAGIRLREATSLLKGADISVVAETPSNDRIDAVGYLMGIGKWSASSAAALKPLRRDPPALVAAAANSPEYLVS